MASYGDFNFYQKIYWGYYYIAEKIENRNYNCIKCFVKKSCFCKKNAQKTFILVPLNIVHTVNCLSCTLDALFFGNLSRIDPVHSPWKWGSCHDALGKASVCR